MLKTIPKWMSKIRSKKKKIYVLYLWEHQIWWGSLKTLVENNYNVVGVITSPDKPAGRGYKIQQSP